MNYKMFILEMLQVKNNATYNAQILNYYILNR